MKILVPGGAGFIGSHIVDAYIKAGHEVAVLDDLSSGKRSNLPSGVPTYELDIRREKVADVLDDFRPAVINHHAAQASVKVSTQDPVYDLAVNGGGTAHLVRAAMAHGVQRFIHCSTGGALYGEPDHLPEPEEHSIEPLSPYGLSKRVGELYVQHLARESEMEYVILRYGNVFGPRQDPHGEAGVMAIFAGRMLSGAQCTIDGDGEQSKDYVYVSDIARASVLTLESSPGMAFNLGTGVGTSVNTIFQTLHEATGNSVDPAHGPPGRATCCISIWTARGHEMCLAGSPRSRSPKVSGGRWSQFAGRASEGCARASQMGRTSGLLVAPVSSEKDCPQRVSRTIPPRVG